MPEHGVIERPHVCASPLSHEPLRREVASHDGSGLERRIRGTEELLAQHA